MSRPRITQADLEAHVNDRCGDQCPACRLEREVGDE